MLQIGENSMDNDKDLALKTFSWIFHTANKKGARPLKMEELQDLLLTDVIDLEFDPDQRSVPRDILAVCHNLVHHNEQTGLLNLYISWSTNSSAISQSLSRLVI